MDKVLKRRLIGASILIALAVIFVPMLLVDPDSVRDGAGNPVDIPPMPDSAREVRRIPLDPDAARAPASEPMAPPRGERREAADASASNPELDTDRISPSDEIVLRPDVRAADPAPEIQDASASADSGEAMSDTGPTPAQPDASAPSAGPEAETSRSTTGERPAAGPAVTLGDWVVQVASFGSREAAEEVRARLDALGHVVARDEIVRGQALLYRLRTGPYPNRAAAEQALAQITATVEGVEPIVREIDRALEDSEAGFAVQVGSFVSEDNADGETARLAGLGFESFRFSEKVGERLIWRVMVGPVSERGDADALKSRLVEQAGVEGLVVSYP